MKANFLSSQLTLLAQTEPENHSVELYEPEQPTFDWTEVISKL
jgi:hypothetical protein